GKGEERDPVRAEVGELIRGFNGGPCHFVGLSMGGFVGMRLAARRPSLVRKLLLMNTGPDREPWPNRLRYGLLAQLVRVVGTAPFTGTAVKALFGETTRRDPERKAMLAEWTAKLRGRPRNTAQALLGAIKRREVGPQERRSVHC